VGGDGEGGAGEEEGGEGEGAEEVHCCWWDGGVKGCKGVDWVRLVGVGDGMDVLVGGVAGG